MITLLLVALTLIYNAKINLCCQSIRSTSAGSTFGRPWGAGRQQQTAPADPTAAAAKGQHPLQQLPEEATSHGKPLQNIGRVPMFHSLIYF